MPPAHDKMPDRSEVYLSPDRKRTATLFLVMDAVFLVLGILFFAYNSLPSALKTVLRYAWLVIMALAIVVAVISEIRTKEYDIFRGYVFETIFLVAGGIWLGAARNIILVDNPSDSQRLFFGVGVVLLFAIMLFTHIDWIWYRPIMHFMTKGAAKPLPEVAEDPAEKTIAYERAASVAQTRAYRRQARRAAKQPVREFTAENKPEASETSARKNNHEHTQETQADVTRVLEPHETAAAARAERLAKLQQARRKEAFKERKQVAKQRAKQQKPVAHTDSKDEQTRLKQRAIAKRKAEQAARVKREAAERDAEQKAVEQQKQEARQKTADNQKNDSPQWARPKKRGSHQGRSENSLFIRDESRVYKHLDR